MPEIEFCEVRKVFPHVVANDGVSFRVNRGSIHAIVGENGAGKSTAMKILYGLYQADSGNVKIRGKVAHFSGPRDALAWRIGMVHQHFMLSASHSALDNVILGSEPTRTRFLPNSLRTIDRSQVLRDLEKISQEYGFVVPWTEPVANLSVGVQQRIEIIKLLVKNSEILILDEPTAVLTPQETDDLFARLKQMVKQGKTVLVITHKLREVIDFADSVTVFRQGRVVGNHLVKEITLGSLAEEMVGRKVKSVRASGPVETSDQVARPESTTLALEFSQVTVLPHDSKKALLSQLSFRVKAGEILGIAGVEGNGQSEVLTAVLQPKTLSGRLSGEIKFFGEPTVNLSALEMRKRGLAFISDDRHRESVLLDHSLIFNRLLGFQFKEKYITRAGNVRWAEVSKDTERLIEEFDVRPREAENLMSALSGGNQQKFVIGREVEFSPRFLVAAQPTRGVDIGAIEAIHTRLREVRNSGIGILLISSELEEILALSDRIIVLCDGRFMGEYDPKAVTEKELGLAMGGAKNG